jgi:hypothetical protein
LQGKGRGGRGTREVGGGIGKRDIIGGERVLEMLRPPIFSFSLWKSWEECHMIYTIMQLRVNLNFCLFFKKQFAETCVNKTLVSSKSCNL